MSKRIYISADYSPDSGDVDVVRVLQQWGKDKYHRVDFIDMSQVVSGSVSADSDCRPCDLKSEFNRQINASSFVIFVVGDKTATRTAGSNCLRSGKASNYGIPCTPYKENANGRKSCKVLSTMNALPGNIGSINSYSYLRHEFEQARSAQKKIIILYNSLRNEVNWLPTYMSGYEAYAHPFWTKNACGLKTGDYDFIKRALDFD